jgi:rhamnose utilization protein RhaD (predicted bifunctional aldolase and dehydrogenase)/NAD(P)-dependent dehydrogenase (short-subunit alcohol dehydrogenase family)
MQSLWNDRDARCSIDRCAGQGVEADLALRIYTTRLLGQDSRLVLHGGGNTSLKAKASDLMGDVVEVLHVKGSGWDMAGIEPAGFSALRLASIRRLRLLETLGDAEMVRVQRACLIDPGAPNPSVETLLHAFIPHRFIDHTHSIAVLSLADQADGMQRCEELYNGRMAIVPYIMPGFALAKISAEIYEHNAEVEGLILLKHGIFTFGSDAREAYERMIEMVSLAEAKLECGRKAIFVSAQLPDRIARLADVAPIVRGACSSKDQRAEGYWRLPILDFRTSPAILSFVNGSEIRRYGQAGVVTPDHTIRTKNWPVVLPAPECDSLDTFKAAGRDAVEDFVARYCAYFTRNNTRCGGVKLMLDPLPRVVLVPGLGLFGLGRSKKDARIVADMAEAAVETITQAEAVGQFESISEAEMFDCEYWSLEQAKLGSAREPPLAGYIAAITGAGGAIGSATARAFADAGAEVALLDINFDAAREQAKAIGGSALAIECDVTSAISVRAALDAVVEAFGGIDIVVSNAGAAWQGRIGEVDETVLRKSFELNFYGHQRIAQNAVRIMLAQGTGGCQLFNVSKQAVNPGANLGPYSLPKAATLFLVRQYALDYGAAGIRSNAVNADRIRSGLLTDQMIVSRSKARGISEQDYMSGNLLGREVTAEDVAQAFLHQALEMKTTGDVTTVDGGNISAALR